MSTLGPISVTTTADDGYQEGGSWLVDGYSNLLYLGGYAGTPYDLGLRFNGITIPKGSTITSAVIELYHRSNPGQASSGTWYAWAHDNAPQFSASNLPRSVSKTSASASWTPAGQNTPGWKSSPNLAAIVQEIINRPGWSSGNSIAFACLSTTYTVGNDCDFEDYSHISSNNARITIEYTAAGGTTYTATLTGSFPSPSGSIGKKTLKSCAGSFPAQSGIIATTGDFGEYITGSFPSPSGSVSKRTSINLAGHCPSPAGLSVKNTSKNLGGSMPPPSGNLSTGARLYLSIAGIMGLISGTVVTVLNPVINVGNRMVKIIGSAFRKIIGG